MAITLDGTAGIIVSGNTNTLSGVTVSRGGGSIATNTAVGASALAATATGNRNTGVGSSSLSSVTSGAENTSVGFYGLLTNTTGGFNTAVGSQALSNNSTGSYNTAIGQTALAFSSTASNNTAVGYQAVLNNSVGASNTAIGVQSLYNNTTASNNVAVGESALRNNTTASGNTAVGYQAGYGNTTGVATVAIGAFAVAGVNTGTYVTATGYYALNANTSGSANAGFGGYSLYSNTTGSNNTASGVGALQNNTTASNNVAMGYQAMLNNTTASNNTAVGYQAGYSATTGAGNTLVGKKAGYSLTTGYNNTFIGFNDTTNRASGDEVTTGNRHSIIGAYTGNQGGLDIRTASNYIVLSDGDGNPRGVFNPTGYFKASNNVTYNSITGAYHEFVNSAADNLIKFTNSNASNPYGFPIMYSAAAPNGTSNAFWDCSDSGGARGAFRSNGGLANYSANNVNLSDRREKTNFAPATSYLDKICAIPVQTFNYIDQNMEDDGGLTLGVVAQDVQSVAPELVMESNWASKDEEPKMRLSIYQTDLQYALMKCIQELKAEFDAYKSTHP